MQINFPPVTFHKSAAQLSQLPAESGVELAFAGRSNAGKSTALNAITGQKSLARTSKTPGRTQLINIFRVDEERRLVDLPGYGYAKVSKQIQARWQQTLAQYLQKRECLRGLILIMDIRHPLKPTDCELIEWAAECELPLYILLTKADKLSRSAALQIQREVAKSLESIPDNLMKIQIISAKKGTGIPEARKQILEWLGLEI